MDRPFVATALDRDELASTSDLAREHVVAGGVPLPLLVRARRQTRGRGRGDHVWWSDEGSLSVTLALDPPAHGLTPAHEPRLALAVAVALVDVLGRHAPGVGWGVRWPNDVEAGGRKVAGILPERINTPDGHRLLIGVGVNVQTRLDDAPCDVRTMAASLHELVGPGQVAPTCDAFLEAWLAALPAVFGQLAADDSALAGRWAALDTLRGQPVRVTLGPRTVVGFGDGVDAEGALVLRTGDGVERLFGGQVLREPLAR